MLRISELIRRYQRLDFRGFKHGFGNRLPQRLYSSVTLGGYR